MRLKGKTALITGGTLGIGKAIALKFAQEGAKVAILDLEVNEEWMQSYKGEMMGIVCDVQYKSQVDAAIAQVTETFGHIDIAVINAGICELTPFLDITEEAWERHIAINLKGAFLVGQAVAKQMVESGVHGSIIHMSSVNGMRAENTQAHYNASKGGLNLLAMSMAVELASHHIRVNALCPGFIATRLTQAEIDNEAGIKEYLKTIPMKRVGLPEEIADAAVFMASDESRYMTGHCLVIDGGQLIKLA
ncbi:NAD(P)-dependent dehydrogenase, short-chain alcohol dehydrogenase family [Paenibacillus tianmuensis]|uniref:NAD(P)-dependent dehydrogenase, short-chain alcohol dehydrogenase family n=1 Tax=Paenibacillus tianmuensis TaxID=624147 RepID=A0A1G4PPY6_9BACL|nr:SDR family NAD(P)-dependent oxidoreductase [Paenibacillus tianmuensis]SCW34373.1 NAD(P)-dependent dehydrogenase, short-chain alcohol dehydrogenase family [Paenibacillus tianmuensis]